MLERDVGAAAARAYRKVFSHIRQLPLKDLTRSTSAGMLFLPGTLILGAVAVPATWAHS